MRQLIKSIFSWFGLEIRKKIHAPLHNAVAYNSAGNTDKFYADERLVALYENGKRLSFYKDMVGYLSQQLDFSKISSIADVSAGTGLLLGAFREAYPSKKYAGFEFSDAALALSKKNCPGITFEKADLYVGIGKTFDLVICVDTLEHLEYPEKAIANLMASVNAGGSLFLVVPNGRYDTFEGHIHYWSPESFRLFIETQGYSTVHSRVWTTHGEHSIIIGRS
jgi:SAM-dependent methyltransferase